MKDDSEAALVGDPWSKPQTIPDPPTCGHWARNAEDPASGSGLNLLFCALRCHQTPSYRLKRLRVARAKYAMLPQRKPR